MMCPLLRPLVALLTLVQPLRSRAVAWNVEDLLYTEEELLGTLFYSVACRSTCETGLMWSGSTACARVRVMATFAIAKCQEPAGGNLRTALENFAILHGDSSDIYANVARVGVRHYGLDGFEYAVRARGNDGGSSLAYAANTFGGEDKSANSVFKFMASRRFIEDRIMEGLQQEMIERNQSKLGFLWNGGHYPVWKTNAIGNQYVQSSATLIHAAEQLEYLVQRHKLPRDFLTVAQGFRSSSHHHRFNTFDGCCFVPSISNLQHQYFLHNTLVYFPKSEFANGRSALNPLVDWRKVAAAYQRVPGRQDRRRALRLGTRSPLSFLPGGHNIFRAQTRIRRSLHPQWPSQ